MTTLLLVGGLGFVTGILAGIALDDALDLWIAARRARRHSKGATMNRPSMSAVLRAALAVILVANLLLGVLLIQQRAASQDFTECVATYQRDFGRAYEAARDSARAKDAALDRIVLAVAQEDQGRFQRALDSYLEARTAQERARRRTPPPPTELCGRPRP